MMVPFSPYSNTFVVSGVHGGSCSNRNEVESLVLICISFMARDGEHFFMCFFLPFGFFKCSFSFLYLE
jgi:hypothetical protein